MMAGDNGLVDDKGGEVVVHGRGLRAREKIGMN